VNTNKKEGKSEYKSDNKTWDENTKTHFINIPIEDPGFIKGYKIWCEEIKKQGLTDFYPELLQKHGKLHMTICVLDLGDQEKIDLVHQLIESIKPELKKISDGNIKFNFDGYDTLTSTQKARVIYAKMKRDSNYYKITEIIHLIIKTLVDNGIVKKEQFRDKHINYKNGRYSITLHMTLLNCFFLNKILKKRWEKQVESINATDIFEYLSTSPLPDAQIDRIHFSRMRENKKIGKYKLVYSYDLIN
jgi:hypothetical protein